MEQRSQGERLQRCSRRQETQPGLPGAAAPARSPARSPARTPGGCQARAKQPGRRWEERGGQRQGLLPATQRLPPVPRQPDAQAPPTPQLTDFPASNYYYYFPSSSIPRSQPLKGTAEGFNGFMSTQRHKATCANAPPHETRCQARWRWQGRCRSGFVLGLPQLHAITGTLAAAHPPRESGQESRARSAAPLSPFAISVFMRPFSRGFDNIIKMLSSGGCSGMPGVPLWEERDAPKLNNPQDIG